MKIFKTFSIITFLLLTTFTTANAATKIEYILDVSGSMNALFGGEKRIDAAKRSIASTVQNIPDGSVVALRLYGHRVSPADKIASCQDSQIVIPFGPINKGQFLAAVNQAQPLGQTPIAYSLEQAAADFTAGADEQPVIILVSDGEESCGGDPVGVAKALLAKGFKVKINVIGLDVDAAAKNQLALIAQTTGGQYFDAKDPAGLSSSLQKLTQDSLVIQKSQAVYGDEIRGGDSYETAVAIPPGKLFRLNHHQRKDQFDYFYVDAKAGQKLTATVQTGLNGVNIRDNTATPNQNPYAGIQIHNSQRQKLQGEEIIGSPNVKKQISVQVPSGGEGRYYVLLGSTYDDQNKDSPFQVDLTEQYDANSQRDAGGNEATSLEIVAGNYEKNYLTKTDTLDVFKFNALPGVYEVKVRATVNAILDVHVFDSDGVEIGNVRSPNEGAVAKIENLQVNKPGYLFIKVSQYFLTSEPEVPYSLSVGLAGAVAAMPGATAAPMLPPTTTTAPPLPPPAMGTIPPPAGKLAVPTAAPEAKTSKSLCENLKALPFLEKAKFIAFWSGIPLFTGWLIGMIWGYIKGRKTGKRKAKIPPPSAPS